MALSVATGSVDTDAVLADERVVDMQNQFRLLDQDENQFFKILNKLPSQSAFREKINWIEDQYFPNLSSVAATAQSSDSQVSVATGEGVYFSVGDLVRVSSSGEILEVTGVTTDDVGVTRSVGSIAAASAATGVELLIIGNANAQGADVRTAKALVRTLGYNYTQIVRHSLSFTGTMEEIETYGAGDPANEIAKKAVEHKRALNNLCWLGARDYNSSTSEGWMGGVITEFLSTNVTNAVGALSLTGLDAALEPAFRYGTMNKVIFAAPKPAAALSHLLANNWVMARPEDEVYGAKVNAFIDGSYGSRIPVITERAWGRESSAGKGRGGWIAVLDLSYIKKRPLRNRGTRLLKNRQNPGIDGITHEYLTEMSLEVAVEKAHALLTGVTG